MTTDASSPGPRGLLACYYAVQFGKTILWVAADLIAFYVLATVERLAAQDLALVLMGGLAWHALSDMAVGQWMERRRGDARGLAWVAGLSVPVACVTFVVALLVADTHPWAALAAMMVSRSTYALFDVPHHALIGRMARRGWPTVRIVGLRNLWGQIASAALGLGLAPTLGPVMTEGRLTLILAAIAGVAGASSLPIVLLLCRLWDEPMADGPTAPAAAHGPRARIAGVLLLHLGATLIVATTSKVALSALAPGIALATVSAGRIAASIPLPVLWRERHTGRKLIASALLLAIAVATLAAYPGAISLFGFGVASGWINILTWAWLSRATAHPRPFAMAAMMTKIGRLASIPLANGLSCSNRC